MVDMDVIEDFVGQVAREFQPEKIVLFGSHADGTAGDDADVDVLVILPFEGKSFYKALEILDKVKPHFPIDLLVRTPEQVRYRLANNDFFLREIMENGKVLYEASYASSIVKD